jgi:hypothetical protein
MQLRRRARYDDVMRVLAGKIVDGRVQLDGDVMPEGAPVSVVVHDGFDVDPELEAELLAALEEAKSGEGISGDEMLALLRAE